MESVGYVRRSAGGESNISRTAQEAAIGAAAAQRGDHVGHVYVDWGKSGSDRTRPAFLAMVAAIEAGTVKAVYCYDADRLARRTATLGMLLDAAAEAGVPVVDRLGRDLAGRDRLVGEFMGVVDSEVLRKMTERNRENARRRRARGDEDGPPPYGHRRERQGERYVFVVDDPAAIARVVDLWHETRSLNATARALNVAGVPADRGGAWHAPSVARVLDRADPGLRDGAKGQGVRAAAKPRLLSRVLRCHCGAVMTPADARRGTRWYCRQAVVGMHGGPRGITETRILPLVKAEAAHLAAPDAFTVPAGSDYDDRAERAALESLRGKVADAIVAAGVADLDAKRAAAAGYQEAVRAVPPSIDWSRPVEDVNAALRALFVVHLGEDLLPVAYDWTVPDWRA